MERPQLAEPNQSDPHLHRTLHETHWNESQEHLIPEERPIQILTNRILLKKNTTSHVA